MNQIEHQVKDPQLKLADIIKEAGAVSVKHVATVTGFPRGTIGLWHRQARANNEESALRLAAIIRGAAQTALKA